MARVQHRCCVANHATCRLVLLDVDRLPGRIDLDDAFPIAEIIGKQVVFPNTRVVACYIKTSEVLNGQLEGTGDIF